MAGVVFDILAGVVLFLFTVWGMGRIFRVLHLPGILGELFAGILLGPNFLDIVPFASDGLCDTILYSADPNATASLSHRMLAATAPCRDGLKWTPRWSGSFIRWDTGPMATTDIWSFSGTVGVTLLIMESGMHINFEKVKQIGGKALIVAIIGTAAPMVVGMLLVAALFPGKLYPDGFSAGCALAPTSVGISIKLLGDAKMLNSMAGQTTLTAAFVDDIFSLVLLVLLSSLKSGSGDVGEIIVKAILAFAFLGFGVVGGKSIYPNLDPLLSRIPFIKGASIQPRDEVHLAIMLLSLVAFSWLGSLIGSHLLGAFVAGMCFVYVPRSHQVWVTQLKRIIRWLIRIFFAATIGFVIPVDKMKEPESIAKGMVLGLVPGIICKVVSGLPARGAWTSVGEKQRASKASFMTRGGLVQPIQYLVGMAMVARGEFAFLVAYSAQAMQRDVQKEDGSYEYMLGEDVYAALTWGLMWALLFAPFLFKWALSIYQRASPIQRGVSIGGHLAAQRNFVIQVIGQHHSGVLHEILNAIHGEGMDVIECRVETDGDVDSNYFVVQSRGKQKDFDDEKLEDIRHHIQEILGDANACVMFEAVASEDLDYAAIELEVVSASSKDNPEINIVSQVTKRLQELGLDVEEIDEQHKMQMDHGHQTEMELDLFYAVPAQESEDGQIINSRRVAKIKKALQSMLRDGGIKAEVVVKPVADRTKGFSELQTFDPQTAMARAKGTVWEILCFGPHNVELLSTAVRKLAPLGVRLLHAAHSHARRKSEEGAEETEREQCSRFLVEKPGEQELGSSEEVTAFVAAVTKVLMDTYKTTDETNFTVKPVDSCTLEEMSKSTRAVAASDVPGLHDLPGQTTPDLNSQRRGVGLKQIPEGGAPKVPQSIWIDDVETSLLGNGKRPAASSSTLPDGGSSAAGGSFASLPADALGLIESLVQRVSRLEALELHAARAAPAGARQPEQLSSLGLPIPQSTSRDRVPPTSPSGEGPKKVTLSDVPDFMPVTVSSTSGDKKPITSSLGLPITSASTAAPIVGGERKKSPTALRPPAEYTSLRPDQSEV